MEVGIVGGGIGGMTTALLLRRSGKSVTLYEKSARLGGRLAFEEGGGYRIDQGPTIVLLPEMLLSILAECGIDRDALKLIECEPMYKIHYADGLSFTKWRDRTRQMEELERCFPGESAGFIRFMNEQERAFREGRAAFLNKAFLTKRSFFSASNVALLARLKAYKSVRAVAREYFRDERLIDAFSLQTLYIGGAPFRTPGLYSLLPYAEHASGVWYIQGGYASLARLMEEQLIRTGVQVRKEVRIDRLVVEKGRCEGVASGDTTWRHEAVVFNGETPLLQGLLPEGSAAAPSRALTPSSGCVLVYLGLNRRWEGACAHQFFLPPSLDAGLRQIFIQGRVPQEPSFYSFYPTALDDDAAPPGESVLYLLIPVPANGIDGGANWAQTAGPLVSQVLEEAERRGFPGLRDAIRWQRVRTPREAEADGLFRGGSFGLAPLLTQSAVFRPQFKASMLAGLYQTGASIHPGGGVPIVMQGARLLAQHMIKERYEWNSSNVLPNANG